MILKGLAVGAAATALARNGWTSALDASLAVVESEKQRPVPAEIARRFDVPDCWLIFRFGYSDPPPRAPRLQTVVIDE